MKIIGFVILLFTCHVSLGQKITINDLVKVVNMDWDQFDTYALVNGFVFEKNESTPMSVSKSYSKEGHHVMNERSITKSIIFKASEDKPYLVDVTYNTEISSEYLLLKSQAKACGFIFVGTQNYSSGAVGLEYEKKKLHLSLIPGRATTKDGYETSNPRYEIAITSKVN